MRDTWVGGGGSFTLKYEPKNVAMNRTIRISCTSTIINTDQSQIIVIMTKKTWQFMAFIIYNNRKKVQAAP